MKKPSIFRAVYQMVEKIPCGRVATYGQIARMVNRGRKRKVNARMVGWALHKNPYAPLVPCHRVVAADGHLKGFARGLEAKEEILRGEGVKIVNQQVDLKTYLWS